MKIFFSNLSPFFGLNPYNTGLGRTSTELEPSDVTVTGHLIGIISHSHILMVIEYPPDARRVKINDQ